MWGEMNPTEDLERDQVMAHQGQRNTPEEMSVRSQHLTTTLGYQGYQADCSVKVVKMSSLWREGEVPSLMCQAMR